MTACNRCGRSMLPVLDALVPALSCIGCGRLIPRTGVKHRDADRTTLNRALRAARRQKLKGGPSCS